jgi:ATP-dependent DNA helicase RecG
MNTSADELLEAIDKGRGERIDWLSDTSPVDAIAATMAAMANTQGGLLLLGIAGPTNSIIGVRDTATALDRMLQAALSLQPALMIPMPTVVQLKNRAVVVAQVPRGMPHIYGINGRYLFREGSKNTTLTPRQIRRLMIDRGEADFETEIVRSASIEDLDWQKAKSYVASLGRSESDIEAILTRRGCVVRYKGRLRPTVAGLLLFGKEPQAFIRGSDITAVRFASKTMGDVFTRQDLGGTLPDQLRRAETFLVDHLRKTMQLGKAMARSERFEYPLEAARELVVNAVAHRDYSISGDGIRLYIFSDHMDVISPGGLPGPVTVANIKDERFSRNPAIVQVLSDMGFIERLGYGVDRVIDLMTQQNLRPPEFEETAGGFRVRLYAQEEAVPVSAAAGTAGDREQSADIIGEFKGLYRQQPINPRQEVALTYLHTSGARITNSELQALCPDVHPETLRRDLADLVNKNILKKLGEKRGSYYVLNSED